MSNICDKTRASLRQRRWEWLDDVELVQRGHCNYRLNSACPPFLLSSNWKPLLYPSCKTEGQLHSVEQCNEKLGGSCSGGHQQQQQQESIEGRAGHGRSWQGTKVTRETGEQGEEEEEEEGITRCGDAIISTLPTAAVCISTVRKKKLETNTCRPKRAVLTAQLRVCLLV